MKLRFDFVENVLTISFSLVKQFAVKTRSVDTLSQFSVDSTTSADSKEPVYIAAGDIRKRLSEHFTAPKSKFEVPVISEVI